ncbi:MAG: hypothetical protein KJ687_02565 [Proteobacteria bacterium]|nr:hypothetical protein [Pseudomonadota bacterium]
MNDPIRQFLKLINSLPLSKKISMIFVIVLVITGFLFMFFWANQENYQILFSNLSPGDGNAIVAELKKRTFPTKWKPTGR